MRRQRIKAKIFKNSPLLTEENGFTLIEMLIAMTIFSIVGLAVFSLFNQSILIRKKIHNVTDEIFTNRKVKMNITRDLAGIQIFDNGPFIGAPDSLCFTSLLSDRTESPSIRYIRYFLQFKPDSENQQLIRSISDFFGNYEETLLLENVNSMLIFYLSKNKNKNGLYWYHKWPDSGKLPYAVRIEIKTHFSQKPLNIIKPLLKNEIDFAKKNS